MNQILGGFSTMTLWTDQQVQISWNQTIYLQ